MIKIGDIAKDTITGFEGVVVGYAKELHNCDRAGLQPRELDGGQPAKTVWFDVPQLELVESDAIAVASVPDAGLVSLGDKVADTLSSLKGTVTAVVTWINGCTRLAIQPDVLKDGAPVDEAWLAASRAKVTKAAKPQPAKRPGGPMRDPMGMRDPM